MLWILHRSNKFTSALFLFLLYYYFPIFIIPFILSHKFFKVLIWLRPHEFADKAASLIFPVIFKEKKRKEKRNPDSLMLSFQIFQCFLQPKFHAIQHLYPFHRKKWECGQGNVHHYLKINWEVKWQSMFLSITCFPLRWCL